MKQVFIKQRKKCCKTVSAFYCFLALKVYHMYIVLIFLYILVIMLTIPVVINGESGVTGIKTHSCICVASFTGNH